MRRVEGCKLLGSLHLGNFGLSLQVQVCKKFFAGFVLGRHKIWHIGGHLGLRVKLVWLGHGLRLAHELVETGGLGHRHWFGWDWHLGLRHGLLGSALLLKWLLPLLSFLLYCLAYLLVHVISLLLPLFCIGNHSAPFIFFSEFLFLRFIFCFLFWFNFRCHRLTFCLCWRVIRLLLLYKDWWRL